MQHVAYTKRCQVNSVNNVSVVRLLNAQSYLQSLCDAFTDHSVNVFKYVIYNTHTP